MSAMPSETEGSMNVRRALPGDVLLNGDAEYRLLAGPDDDGQLLVHEIGSGSRVQNVALEDVDDVVRRRDHADDMQGHADAEPPQPPADAPAYVLDGLGYQDSALLRELGEYALALAQYKAPAPVRDPDLVGGRGTPVEHFPAPDGKGTIWLQEVSCGKSNCGKCPHGPYAWRVWREGDDVVTQRARQFDP